MKLKCFLKQYAYILIPIFVTVFMLITCRIYYIVNDDLGITRIAKSHIHGSENLVFVNIIYGCVFKALFAIIPWVNWVAVTYLALITLSMILLQKIAKDNGSQIFAVGLFALLQAVVIVRITFTAVAFLCCGTAVMWVMHKADKLSRNNVKYFIHAFLLFIAGFGLRRDMFIFIILIYMPFYVFAVSEKRTKLSVVITLLILCTLSHFALNAFQKAYRATIPEETFFNQFNEFRSTLTDKGTFNYEKSKELYEAEGISKNDVKLVSEFMYADRNVFDYDTLKTLAESKDFDNLYTFNIKGIVKNMLGKAFIWWYILAALIGLIFLKKNRLEVLSVSVFTIAAITYLFVRQRGVDRVINQISVAGIIMLACIAMRSLKDKHKLADIASQKLVAAVLVCLFGANIATAWARYYNIEKPTQERIAILNDYKTSHPGIKLLSEPGVDGITDFSLKLLTKNINEPPVNVVFGGWRTYTAQWYEELKELGVDNSKTFNAVLDPDVRLVAVDDMSPEMIKVFLKEHYDISAEYTIEDKFEELGVSVYSFLEKQGSDRL